MARWRRFLLTRFGAELGAAADVRGPARVWFPPNLIMEDHTILAEGVDCYNMARVRIGARTVVSQRAFLCGGTHDYERSGRPLRVRPISIGADCWIAAEAFVGPGAVLEDGVVLGARAAAFGTLPGWTAYSGNPARPLKPRKPEAP